MELGTAGNSCFLGSVFSYSINQDFKVSLIIYVMSIFVEHPACQCCGKNFPGVWFPGYRAVPHWDRAGNSSSEVAST